VKASIAGENVKVKVTTDYPWDGKIAFEVEPQSPVKFDLRLRVPAWCEGGSLSVNKKAAENPRVEKGYWVLTREWHKGDVVKLDLPMPIRRVAANPLVKADLGKLAIQRGPIVYCLEACDQGCPLSSLYMPADAELKAEKSPGLLGGVVAIKGFGEVAAEPGEFKERLYATAPAHRRVLITAVPYFAWDNRKHGAMEVWVPVSPSLATTTPK